MNKTLKTETYKVDLLSWMGRTNGWTCHVIIRGWGCRVAVHTRVCWYPEKQSVVYVQFVQHYENLTFVKIMTYPST